MERRWARWWRWAVEHCITPPCGGLCVLLPPPPTTTTTATAEQEAEEDNDESDDEESANRKRLRKRTMTVVGCGNDSHRMCRVCLTKQVFEAALRERRVACCPPCVEWGCTATLLGTFFRQES